MRRVKVEKICGVPMFKELLEWLMFGECGASSAFLCRVLVFGIEHTQERSRTPKWLFAHPSDAHDFRRCERFLREVPGMRERFEEVFGTEHISPEWTMIYMEWDKIVKAMEYECPSWFSAEYRVDGDVWPERGNEILHDALNNARKIRKEVKDGL